MAIISLKGPSCFATLVDEFKNVVFRCNKSIWNNLSQRPGSRGLKEISIILLQEHQCNIKVIKMIIWILE